MIRSNLLLRLAIALAFLYAAISSLLVPAAWIGYFPHFMLGILPDTVLLSIWSLVEVVIALWILSGKNIFLPSIAACVLLLAIVLFNLPLLDILFRDVALALVALYLALTARAFPFTHPSGSML